MAQPPSTVITLPAQMLSFFLQDRISVSTYTLRAPFVTGAFVMVIFTTRDCLAGFKVLAASRISLLAVVLKLDTTVEGIGLAGRAIQFT